MKPLYFVSAFVVFSIKLASRALYNTKANWITPRDKIDWENAKLAVILNHTSLYEFLFLSVIPNYRLWRALKRVVLPIADVTMNRPLVGMFFKLLVPNAHPITRKRDETWESLVAKARGNSLVVIFPEGRMMRKNGLDKNGKPMSIKGGVADLLETLDTGKLLIVYSGGLHHVQAPGEWLPRIFKEIRVSIEELDIQEYKKNLPQASDFRSGVILDLETRKKQHC